MTGKHRERLRAWLLALLLLVVLAAVAGPFWLDGTVVFPPVHAVSWLLWTCFVGALYVLLEALAEAAMECLSIDSRIVARVIAVAALLVGHIVWIVAR